MQHTAPADRIREIAFAPPRLTPLAVRLMIVAICLNAVVLAITGLSVYSSRVQYYFSAEITSRNVAAIVAESVSSHLARVDAALEVIVDEAQRDGIAPGSDLRPLQTALRRAQARVPHALMFRVAGPDGRIVAADQPGTDAGIDISDREYFKTLRRKPEAGLVISPPVTGKISNQWVLVLARRITGADGGFAGVAYSSIAIKTFADMFSAVWMQPGDGITLRAEGPLSVVARFPQTVGTSGVSAVGNTAVSQDLQDMVARSPKKGTYVATPPIDNIERVLSYHKLEHYPYYMLVGNSTEPLKVAWLRDASRVIALCVLFMLISAAGVWWMLVSLRVRQTLEARLRLIEFAVDHAAEAVLLLGSNGTVVYGNTAAANLFQRQPEGSPIWTLGAGVEGNDWVEHWRELVKGERVTVSTKIRRPDGGVIPAVISACRLAFGNEEFEVSIIRDIGEQIQHEHEMEQSLATSRALGEALARGNEALARFAEILAHHMKEPVRHQHIFAQRLVRMLPPPLAPEVRETLACIIDGATRHLAMLRDAQRYLSLDQPNSPAQPVPGDISIDRALERLGDRIRARGAVIRRQPLPDLPVEPTALADVLLALIDNALTYCAPGVDPVVSVGSEMRGGEVVVTITDNGIGIPPELRVRVFRVFERLDPRPELPGTGIGLALAKKIVEGCGGRIWIEQPAEPGTRVCLAFAERQVTGHQPLSSPGRHATGTDSVRHVGVNSATR